MGTANYEGASGPAFELYQVYPNDVGTFFATSKSVECPTYMGLVGETKYWEEEQRETADERIYSAEGEEDEDAEQHELQIALALSKEDPLVEELATRCNDFDTTPHVPRVNGEIPQESSSDAKQRLADRLSKCGLSENKMEGDGNCQFRALSDQLFGTPDKHMFVRRRVVWQLTAHQDIYSEYVPMEYSQYLENMARDGEWGDHVSLQAAADLFGAKITLITSFKDTCKIEIIPAQQKFNRGHGDKAHDSFPSPLPDPTPLQKQLNKDMICGCFKGYISAFGRRFTTIPFTHLELCKLARQRMPPPFGIHHGGG